jgi:Thioredoxin like C-terminal domain
VLGGRGEVSVLVDGARVRTVRVAGTPRLYTLLGYRKVAKGLLELRVSRGVQAYSFTFG